MFNLEFNLDKSFQSLKGMADWISLREVVEKITFRSIQNEKPEANSIEIQKGVMIEVLVDGHFGYSGTSDITASGLELACKKAVATAKAAAKFKVHHFEPALRPQAIGNYLSPILQPLDSISAKEINDILIEATRVMKVSDKVFNRAAGVMIKESFTRTLNSSGSDFSHNIATVSTDFQVTSTSGSETQSRSDNGGYARCYQIGAEAFNRAQILERAQKIAEQSVELLTAENCPSDKMNLILAPDQMTLQVHESIGHPLEYDRILGDERNYAGWSFVKPEDFGTLKYGSAKMNVTFDPTVADELASYSFDDAGNKATKEYLIKDGVLQRGLGSLESQARLGLPGVANSRSTSWNRAPIDRMANINLEAGEKSLEAIISEVEKGIFMESNKSWSIDDYRNKFQFGCEYARLIENGKLTNVVRNPNYRGTTVNFWNNLKEVSKVRESYGSPFCGKGEPNQVIYVGHTTPYCLFENIEVFGA